MSLSRRVILAAFLSVFVILAVGCRDKPASKSAQSRDFVLKDLQGNDVALADYRGKVVLLEFWATWCPPCRMAVPDLVRLHERFRDRGFAILALSVDESPSKVRTFAEDNGITYTVLIDDQDVNVLYGVRSIPTAFILDKDGQVVSKHLGYTPEMTDLFAEEIEGLL